MCVSLIHGVALVSPWELPCVLFCQVLVEPAQEPDQIGPVDRKSVV